MQEKKKRCLENKEKSGLCQWFLFVSIFFSSLFVCFDQFSFVVFFGCRNMQDFFGYNLGLP